VVPLSCLNGPWGMRLRWETLRSDAPSKKILLELGVRAVFIEPPTWPNSLAWGCNDGLAPVDGEIKRLGVERVMKSAYK